jgi:hypothetical protein
MFKCKWLGPKLHADVLKCTRPLMSYVVGWVGLGLRNLFRLSDYTFLREGTFLLVVHVRALLYIRVFIFIFSILQYVHVYYATNIDSLCACFLSPIHF